MFGARLVPAALLACAGALVVAGAVPAADPPRYRAYYDIFNRGKALIPHHDTRYVPQGLAYWPEQDALAISYYDAKHGASRIAIADRASGTRRKTLVLKTDGHVGGMAASTTYLWVANNGKVTRYRKSALASAADGATISGSGTWSVHASSYMTIRGNQMWVGSFDNNRAYRYSLNGSEAPVDDRVTITTPSKVQGMAVTSRNYIWSRSYGRTNDSVLEIRPLNAPAGPGGKAIVAPNLSEGLAIAGSELHVVYEAAATEYADATYRVRTIHHGPLSKLGGA